jgi:hypothetical protein
MRLLAILGLGVVFTAVAYAGEGNDRICDPCDGVTDSICPTEDWTTIAGDTSPGGYSAYAFNGVAGGVYTFTFCMEGGSATFDTGLSIQGPDNCGPDVACNDDFCGLQSELTWTCTYDATWLIAVDGFADAMGPFVLAYRGTGDPSPADHTAWGSIKALFR